MSRFAFAAAFLGGVLAATPAFAQFNFGGMSALTIRATPAHPAPNSIVHLVVQSPLLDLGNSAISWSVGGTPAGNGTSIDVQVGPGGSKTNISVSVTGASGNDFASMTIVPASVDLLWEADSYTPPFYQGRAVPTSGSVIRVYAVPHLVHGGSDIAPSALNFSWKVNGAALTSQSGRGKNSALIPAATLFSSDTITVDVQTPDGSISGEATATIRTQDPQLVLYEDSPLFGIMYHKAIGQSGGASGSETSFAAVPYFIDAPSTHSNALAYEWRVNGSLVATDATVPNELTISAQSAGIANVTLSISKPSDPFVSAQGSWSVSFGASNTAGAANVFHTRNQ